MQKSLYIVIILSLLLNACAQQENKPVALIPVDERNVPIDKVKNNDAVAETGSAVYKSSPVIVALIEESSSYRQQGDTDRAIATIERGIRIEPNDYRLWHEFSLLRFQQQQWQQAVALARKSNALAGSDLEIKNRNWELIANCYDNLGNKQKAREARENIKLSS